MDTGLKLKEAARLVGLSLDALNKRIAREGIPTIMVPESERSKRLVKGLTLDTIQKIRGGESAKGYDQHWQVFLERKRVGFTTGRPLGPRSLEMYHMGLGLFWKTLGLEPSLDGLTFDNLRWAIAKFVPKAYGATDGFASKEKIYKAFRGFYEYLMDVGVKSDKDWRAIVKYKPKRTVDKRSPYLAASELMKLIRANRYQQGRSFFDRQLTHTLIYLYAFAGLRRSEALRLKISDIKFNEDYLHVHHSKGGKSRDVVMWPPLKRQLARWIEYLPQAAIDADRLICNAEGDPLTANAVNLRFLRLTRRPGSQKINIHGLRKTFGTELQYLGADWASIKSDMGHSDIKVTEGYVGDKPGHKVGWMRLKWAEYKGRPPVVNRKRRRGEEVT